MPDLSFEIEIAARADTVFALLADLRGYDTWLPRSRAFHGTSSISDGPITVGTSYIEQSPFGTRRGRVTAFERPFRLDFVQPMTLRPAALGMVDISVYHELTSRKEATVVKRNVLLEAKGAVRMFMPIVTRAFLDENRRMLQQLKLTAERADSSRPVGGN